MKMKFINQLIYFGLEFFKFLLLFFIFILPVYLQADLIFNDSLLQGLFFILSVSMMFYIIIIYYEILFNLSGLIVRGLI